MKQNFSLSGFPDFTSMEIARRQYVLSKIQDKFNCFGFLPISTSILEKRSNLVDSYGDDGDKLIFQILRSGDYLSKLQLNTKKLSSKDLSELISDKSLRYDLTVPFARFTAKNQSQITFPFKRYEIGYVFRADRPQRGRFRQFIQCDADIIGSRSLWLEIDLINLINSVFTSLSLKDIVIKISNRKVLEGIFNSFTTPLSFTEFCIIIDKLDKINIDKVGEILLEKEFLKEDVMFLKNLFSFKGSFEEKKKFILSKVTLNNTLETGFNELTFILDRIPLLNQLIDIDFSLARGLDYYTGLIFEVCSLTSSIGSLLGGGRYDQLTEKFNLKNVSGVGVSFGLDRLCLALEESNLFPEKIKNTIDFVFINFGIKESENAQIYVMKLRNHGFSAELYPDLVKINKQMSYADKRGAKFVVMIGEEEMKNNKMTVRNMLNGNQQLLTFDELIKTI